MNFKKIYWIGPRFSDVKGHELFHGSITSYGFKGKNNYVYYDQLEICANGTNEEMQFINDTIDSILLNQPDAKFMLYDQSLAKHINRKDKLICVNNSEIINLLNSKFLCKAWAVHKVKVIPYITMFSYELEIKRIKNYFPGVHDFILQTDVGHSGQGTIIINVNTNLSKIKQSLTPCQLVTLSPFLENASNLNIHCIVSRNKYILFPISEQIISSETNKMIYSGNKFNNHISQCIQDKINDQSKIICETLKSLGYLGVVGIDFIEYNDEVYFVEINPRFQGSTRVINLALQENKQESLYDLQLKCFFSELPDIKPFDVDYNLYVYTCGIKTEEPCGTLYITDNDEYNPKAMYGNEVYLYRKIYKH